jgi:hypothetical protein
MVASRDLAANAGLLTRGSSLSVAMVAGVISRAVPRVDVPKSIAVCRTIDSQVASSISLIPTGGIAKTESATPKASVAKTSAADLSGSNADRWGDGDSGDSSGDQQYARHVIILSISE